MQICKMVFVRAVLSCIRLDYSIEDGVQSEHLRRTNKYGTRCVVTNKSWAPLDTIGYPNSKCF